MATLLEVIGPRSGSAPLSYELNERGTVDLQSVFAHFDGSGASGSFRPALTIRSQNGTILARVFPSGTLAAGDTADVSYIPFSGDAAGDGGIPETLLDAKGDLIVASADDTAARHPVGADGTILTADSSQPLGVTWATAAPGTSAIELVSSTTLGADAPFDVSGLDQSYADLLLHMIVRGARVSGSDLMRFRFNGDTGLNYSMQGSTAVGGVLGAPQETAQSSGYLLQVPADTANAGVFGTFEIYLPGYSSTTWLKSVLSRSSQNQALASGSVRLHMVSALWLSTAAITRIELFGLSVANMLAGSRLNIYGVR